MPRLVACFRSLSRTRISRTRPLIPCLVARLDSIISAITRICTNLRFRLFVRNTGTSEIIHLFQGVKIHIPDVARNYRMCIDPPHLAFWLLVNETVPPKSSSEEDEGKKGEGWVDWGTDAQVGRPYMHPLSPSLWEIAPAVIPAVFKRESTAMPLNYGGANPAYANWIPA